MILLFYCVGGALAGVFFTTGNGLARAITAVLALAGALVAVMEDKNFPRRGWKG